MDATNLTTTYAAAAWLLPPKEAPWQWDADGEAITWSDGATILFRQELADIVELLPPNDVPFGGAVILLLAACRGKVPALEGLPAHILPAVEGLRKIAGLPPELLRGIANRAVLVNHLLDHAPGPPVVTVPAILNLLRGAQPLDEIFEEGGRNAAPFRQDLQALLRPLAKMDSGALEMLLRTGMPAAPSAAGDLELPASVEIGAFLDELLADPELSAIAKAARRIMAAVSLPEALSHHDDEALGGFSDIGNRGPLHRLLLSELAHDDDTLCARIALNEALYLRREPAADHPPTRLAVLVDCGLRMWGVPRIFATATALAFLAKGGKYRRPAVYRTHEGKAAPGILWTKPGLIEHLEALDTAIDPVHALAALSTSLNEQPGMRSEVLVITHRLALNDPAFMRAIRELDGGNIINFYTAGVDRDGNIIFQAPGVHGVKPLAEARINLADLFSREIRTRDAALREPPAAGPAILREKPLPFLLPVEQPVDKSRKIKDGVNIALTKSGTLWQWSGWKRGAFQLNPIPMRGTTLGLIADDSGEYWFALKHRTNEACVDVVRGWLRDDATPDLKLLSFAVKEMPRPPLYSFARGGCLYLVLPKEVVVVTMHGRLHGKYSLPASAHPIGGRFLVFTIAGGRIVTGYGAFSWNGAGLAVSQEKMPKLGPRPLPGKPVLIFERHNHPSPWAVNSDGRIYSMANPVLDYVLANRAEVLGATVTPSGNNVALQYSDGLVIADLNTKKIGPALYKGDPEFFLGSHESPHHWSMRSKFTHAALCSSGQVALLSHKGVWWKIEFNEGRFKLVTPAKDVSQSQPFARKASDGAPSFDLRLAQWEDGSRAWLDPRGLLHLQSRDAAIPEVTFVLAESRSLPAWSSDGRKIGPEYFIGDHKPDTWDAQEIDSHVREFVAAALIPVKRR